MSFFIPYQILFSFYILSFIGLLIVSESKNVDIGIGDSWYAPINDSCKILFIDTPEQAYIEYNEESIVSEVSHIQQIKDKLFGETYSGKYFSFDLVDKKYIEYQSFMELSKSENLNSVKLIKVIDFYEERKSNVAGIAIILVGILSLLISISLAVITFRLIIFGKIKK